MITKISLREKHLNSLGFATPIVEDTYRDKFLPQYEGGDWAVHGYDEINHNMVFSAFHGEYKYRWKYYYQGLYLPLRYPVLGDIIVYDARYVIWD